MQPVYGAKYNYAGTRIRSSACSSQGAYTAPHIIRTNGSLSATGLYRPAQNVTIALAQDGVVNTLNSTMTECPNPTRYSSLTALSARWNTPHFTLSGTLTGTYITETVETGDRPDDISKINPSLSMSVKPWSTASYTSASCIRARSVSPHSTTSITTDSEAAHSVRRKPTNSTSASHGTLPVPGNGLPFCHPRCLLQRCHRQNRGIPHHLRPAHGELRKSACHGTSVTLATSFSPAPGMNLALCRAATHGTRP